MMTPEEEVQELRARSLNAVRELMESHNKAQTLELEELQEIFEECAMFQGEDDERFANLVMGFNYVLSRRSIRDFDIHQKLLTNLDGKLAGTGDTEALLDQVKDARHHVGMSST